MTIHLCHQGRQLGEFSKDQVEAMLKVGVIVEDTMAWTSGLREWKKLREILAPALPPPVPPPPPPSSPTIKPPETVGIPPIIVSPRVQSHPLALGSQLSRRRMALSTKWVVGLSLAFVAFSIMIVVTLLRQLPHAPNSDPTDPIAQCNLGIESYKKADYVSALRWLRKSADQGNAKAQYNLAFMMMQGVGVPKDEAEASRLIWESAKQGYANAQAVLGKAYLDGKLGLLKDEAEGVKWLKSASQNGCAGAQLQLARCYLDGIGVPQNKIKAYAWFSVVLENGDKSEDDSKKAGFFRDATKLLMSPAEIDEANSYVASMQR